MVKSNEKDKILESKNTDGGLLQYLGNFLVDHLLLPSSNSNSNTISQAALMQQVGSRTGSPNFNDQSSKNNSSDLTAKQASAAASRPSHGGY